MSEREDAINWSLIVHMKTYQRFQVGVVPLICILYATRRSMNAWPRPDPIRTTRTADSKLAAASAPCHSKRWCRGIRVDWTRLPRARQTAMMVRGAHSNKRMRQWKRVACLMFSSRSLAVSHFRGDGCLGLREELQMSQQLDGRSRGTLRRTFEALGKMEGM